MATIEEDCRQIEDLWREHQDAPFPMKCLETEQANCLVHLDSSLSGCVSTFLARGYTLDLWRMSSLGICYRAVALVLVSPGLPEEARLYYARLETMAGLVLEVVGRKAKSDD